MRIFLTGASGFLGRHLIPLLNRHDLLLIGRNKGLNYPSNVSYIQGDLTNGQQWERMVADFSPELCVHLAWMGLPDYSLRMCLLNFEMSVRLFEVMIDIGCRKVFAAGTCWEYGDLQGKVSEKDVPESINLFASFKTGLRLVGESLAASRKIDFIWGRIFFVYGLGQRESSLIPSCYKALKEGRSPNINNPLHVNDFIHVSDAVSAISALIETPNISGVFNIGSGSPSTVGEVVKIIAKRMKSEKLLPKYSDPSEEGGMWADRSLIERKTRWKPLIPLASGIDKTITQLESRE